MEGVGTKTGPAQTHTERFRPVHNPESGRNPPQWGTARTIIQAKRPHSPLTGPTSTTKGYLAYKRIRILSFATQVSMNERMLAFEPTRIPSWWQYRS